MQIEIHVSVIPDWSCLIETHWKTASILLDGVNFFRWQSWGSFQTLSWSDHGCFGG